MSTYATRAFAVNQPTLAYDIGASADAQRINRLLADEQRRFRNHASDWRSSVPGLLSLLIDECAAPNWDGYDAQPVSLDAVDNVGSLIDSLPFGLPEPDISADPDGEVSLTWDFGPKRVLSVSVGSRGIATIAALFTGGGQYHGVEPTYHHAVSTIEYCLDRLTNHVG